MSKKPNSITITWYAFTIVFIGSLITYFIHNPVIGIDDANITQVYAKNLADGLGYVYNEGGERVEGSTSWLWTVINVGVFYTVQENPEIFIAILCFFLTLLTIREVICLLRDLSLHYNFSYTISVVFLFCFLLSNPGYFAWNVWTLMDVTLWTLLFTIIVCRFSLVFLERITEVSDSKSVFTLSIALLLLPLVRPEGVAISLGFAFLFILLSHHYGLIMLRNAMIFTFGITLFLIAVLTVWRLYYFGFPVPNTFYAKVSVDYLTQLLFGLDYFTKYLLELNNLIQLVLALGLIVYVYFFNHSKGIFINSIAIVWFCAFLGIFSIYTFLGGDHFGSFRQFQILSPLLAALASVAGAKMIFYFFSNIKWTGAYILLAKKGLIGLMLVGSLFVSVQSFEKYLKTKGKIDHEFRIAEGQRALGSILNELPSSPTLGVITAGGIARTYNGYIFDLMGLNWTAMAHFNRSHNLVKLKNHASFSKEIFMEYQPDIVVPMRGKCVFRSNKEVSKIFANRVLTGLLVDDWFTSSYIQACFKGIVFYVSNKFGEQLRSILDFPE